MQAAVNCATHAQIELRSVGFSYRPLCGRFTSSSAMAHKFNNFNDFNHGSGILLFVALAGRGRAAHLRVATLQREATRFTA